MKHSICFLILVVMTATALAQGPRTPVIRSVYESNPQSVQEVLDLTGAKYCIQVYSAFVNFNDHYKNYEPTEASVQEAYAILMTERYDCVNKELWKYTEFREAALAELQQRKAQAEGRVN